MSGRCPGQDTSKWKPEDIFEDNCPQCGRLVEFFKDEPRRTCKGCGKVVFNPKIDVGCAKWCSFADQCMPTAGMTEEEKALRHEALLGAKSPGPGA